MHRLLVAFQKLRVHSLIINTTRNDEIADVPLKHLTSFRRTLDVPLIYCEL